MSKAFTSESDSDDARLEPAPLPPGIRNYMTPEGERALRAQMERLQTRRETLPAERVEDKAERERIDQQLHWLGDRLAAAHVVDPLTQPKDLVLFGASVTLAITKQPDETWRIVGIDETELSCGWISWRSPLAGALLEKRVGDQVTFLGRTFQIKQIVYLG